VYQEIPSLPGGKYSCGEKPTVLFPNDLLSAAGRYHMKVWLSVKHQYVILEVLCIDRNGVLIE
jgi:hypothetical protein